MLGSRIVVCLLVASALLLGAALPAAAEFTSLEKTASGKLEALTFALEAGGATMACKSEPEKSEWTVQSGKEALKKGPTLLIHLNGWSKCAAKTSLVKEAKAQILSCALEMKQAKEEEAVPVSIASSCLVLVGECKVLLEPSENKELKQAELAYTGKENKATWVEAALEGASTKAPGCKAIGIESAAGSGKVAVIGAAAGVIAGFAVPQYALSVVGGLTNTILRTVGEEREAVVWDLGAEGKPSALSAIEVPFGGGFLTASATEVKNCKEQTYNAASPSCTMKALYAMAVDPSKVASLKFVVFSANGVSKVTFRA